MGSIYKVLDNLGVKLNLNAPTVANKTWAQILNELPFITKDIDQDDNLIHEVPVNESSGVEVLSGNFFDSAVVKISGMSTEQKENFNNRYFVVKYYEDEHLCNADFADPDLLNKLQDELHIDSDLLNALARHNGIDVTSVDNLEQAIKAKILSFAFIIGGQGPKAYGMPEMFSPSQNLRHHSLLESSSILMTDGRYSGVTKGACIGHATPEVFSDGDIGYLLDGDILHMNLTTYTMNVMASDDFKNDDLDPIKDFKSITPRCNAHHIRKVNISQRRLDIATSNLLTYTTSAETGVVPLEVNDRATVKIDLS